jgi:hypothetical protein
MELPEPFPTMTEVRHLEYVGFSSEQIACLERVKALSHRETYHEATPRAQAAGVCPLALPAGSAASLSRDHDAWARERGEWSRTLSVVLVQ